MEAMTATPITSPKNTNNLPDFDFSLVFLIKFLKFIFKMVQYETVPQFINKKIKKVVFAVLLCYAVVFG